jgi:hypothetical protein
MLEGFSLASSGIWSRTISIPAASMAAGGNILDTLRSSGYYGAEKCCVEINGVLTGGSDRAAILIGSPASSGAAVVEADVATHGRYIAAGALYTSVNAAEARLCNWRASADGAVAANVTVHW